MDPIKIKSLLKTIKLHENSLSVIFGVIFIVVFGTLALNYFSKNRGEITPPSVSGEGTQQRVHKVQRGEDLWKISEKYYGDGFKWVDIAKANNLDNPRVIEVDTEINIPEIIAEVPEDATDPTATVTTTPSQTTVPTLTETVLEPEPDNSIDTDTYVVVKGDNLWDICTRAYGDGYKWVEIARVNNIENPDIILPGMSLTLPK